MLGSETEIAQTIDEMIAQTGTEEPEQNLRSQSLWSAVRDGRADVDTVVKAGLEVASISMRNGRVDLVTFRLNETWQGVKERAASRSGGL